MNRYAVSGAVRRDLSTVKGESISLKEFKITKPTVICLGGDMTCNATLADNMCATIERIIGLRVKGSTELSTYNHIEMIGFFYGKDKETDKTFCFSEEDRDDIVNHILLPLCVDEAGNLLPLEQICKNFALINFFTHCHGAYELCKITEKLHKILLNKGLTNEQAHKVYAQSFHCSYASNWKESFYPTMYIYSLTDKDNWYMAQLYRENYGEDLNGVSIKHDVPGKFLTENINSRNYNDHVHHDTITVFSSRLVNTPPEKYFKHIYDEHSYIFLDRNAKNWCLSSEVVYTKNADLVSKMTAYAMAVNIASSLQTYHSNTLVPKMPILELKSQLEDLLCSYNKEDLQIVR